MKTLLPFLLVCFAAFAQMMVPPAVTVGPGSGQVIVTDINRDGHADLLTRHLLERRINIQLGRSKLDFAPAPSFIALADLPGSMALGDLNLDGNPDLAVSSSASEDVVVLLGDGKAGFRPAPGSPFRAAASGGDYTRGIHLLHLNGDRYTDIVTVNNRARLAAVLFGKGDGTFTPGPVTRVGHGGDRCSIAFGDSDGDGRPDAITLCFDEYRPGLLTIQRGDGMGRFRSDAAPLKLSSGGGFLTAVDLNDDSLTDLVISHTDGDLSILLNTSGRFATPSPVRIGLRAYGVTAADLNGDGKKDLIAAAADSIAVLLADGSGYAPAPGSPYRAGPGAYSVTAADINGDGVPDIAAPSFDGTAVTLLASR